ncbi:hypothetical protein Tco_0106959 [Tanacetum coccineum]
MRIVYTGYEGQVLFTSHAWRRLFEIRALLVPEFILEFFNTCRISDTELELDVANTLCFQLGIARRRMTWMEFILALGLHTTEEMVEVEFEAYCISSRGQIRREEEERSQDVQETFFGRIAKHFGLVSKEGLMGLYVISRMLLVINLDELFKLKICVRLGDTWAWVASGPERQPIVASGSLEVAEGAPNVDEGA